MGDRISKERRALYKKAYSLFPQLLWKRNGTNKNRTLIHGDAHIWNFMFPNDIQDPNSEVYITDWATWSPGFAMSDLAYMIALHWFPERRHLMEKNLVKRYYDTLVLNNVKNVDIEY